MEEATKRHRFWGRSNGSEGEALEENEEEVEETASIFEQERKIRDNGGSDVLQYNPYQQINLPYRKLYDLPTSPQFLFEEEAKKTRLSWGESFLFFTGSGYLSGAAIGAAKGSIDGIRAAERGESLKIRANRILNSGGLGARRGGYCLGSLGLMYAALQRGVTYLRGGDDGSLSTVIAGLATGAIYRAASGPRSAVIAGAVGGITAFVAVSGRVIVRRFIHI